MLGLEAYEGCPRDALRGATRRALENLVRLAIDEKAALLLVAGDLYDGAWKDHQTGLYFASQMRKLRRRE
jgi:DNA repair exonuclease SbcCD nuclease subunit